MASLASLLVISSGDMMSLTGTPYLSDSSLVRLCTASVCGEAADEAEAEPLLTEKGEAGEEVAGAKDISEGTRV